MSKSHLFVQHLTVLDNAILDQAHGLVGESWIVDLELSGPLNDEGMVMDFGKVKRHIKQQLDALGDHRLIVPAKASWLTIAGSDAQPEITAQLADGTQIIHASPAQALCLLPVSEIGIEAMVLHAHQLVVNLLAEQGLSHITPSIHLRTEQITGDYYHYCHGLKKHGGNCQRIAHGHRSQVKVYVDDIRKTDEEAYLASLWNRRYLGSAEDLKKQTEQNGVTYNHFAHVSDQGEFALTIAAHHCDVLPHDTTVEWLASTLAARVKARHPHSIVKVQGFEGVDKGAFGHVA